MMTNCGFFYKRSNIQRIFKESTLSITHTNYISQLAIYGIDTIDRLFLMIFIIDFKSGVRYQISLGLF